MLAGISVVVISVSTPIRSGFSIVIVGAVVHFTPPSSVILPILSAFIVTTARGITAQVVPVTVTRGLATYPAPFSVTLTVKWESSIFVTVAVAGIIGGSILRVGLPVQKAFCDRVTAVTLPFDTVAVAVGGVVQTVAVPILGVTFISGVPRYPEPEFVTVAVRAAFSFTIAVAVICGAEIVRVGADVQVPPVSVMFFTIPFSIVDVAVGNIEHLFVPLTTTVGGYIYPIPHDVILATVPSPFVTAVAVTRVVGIKR
jgi:hypothetical protein